MSKVIEYLPVNVPRILINRTVAHPPPHVMLEEDSDDEEPEFRENYVFDAYMLGYCDDVTRRLVKAIKQENSSEDEGKLLASLRKNDKEFLLEEWQSTKVPPDRVFLFPGATCAGDTSEVDYQEIAHCDGCTKEIQGRIHKCTQCFDFDLCATCYPKIRRSHCDGKHKFTIESR